MIKRRWKDSRWLWLACGMFFCLALIAGGGGRTIIGLAHIGYGAMTVLLVQRGMALDGSEIE